MARNGFEVSTRGRYLLIGLCAACLGVSYCDRVNLSVAILKMAEENDWNITEKGRILSGFFYGYMISQVLGAILSSKFGGHKVLGIAAFFWSLLTILVPFAASFGTSALFLNRVLVGVFEGVSFPVVYHLFALNIPENERSRSVSILSINVSFGAVLAFYLSPIIIERHSWQAVFYFFGSIGMFWCIIWTFFWMYNESVGFKGKHKLQAKSSSDDVKVSVKDQIKDSVMTIRKLFKYKAVLGILYCHFCHNIGHYVILSWLPTFLENLGVQGENLSITCVPYIFMAGFAVFFGTAADRMIAKGPSKDDEYISQVRRYWTVRLFVGAALSLIILTFFIESHEQIALVLVFLSLALGLNASCPVAGYESAKLDLIVKEQVGILQGVSNTFATLSGVIGVPIVSLIHSSFHSWTPVFWWIAAMFLSAALVFQSFGRWSSKIRI